jgi:pimeloyl-ACP methyl ester carboxylesterase
MKKERFSRIQAGWSEGDITVEKLKIHYYRASPPAHRNSIPVVLLHGAADNGLCWMRVACALQNDHDIIMLDARGHGLSDAPRSGYGPRDFAADTVGVIKALDLHRPVLAGHSMGAETAAVTGLLYPDLVRGIVLEDPPWFAEDDREHITRKVATEWSAWIREQKSRSVGQLISIGKAEHPGWDPVEWEPWAQSKRQVSPCVVSLLEAEHPPWQEVVKTISCPVLLITGDNEKGCLVTPGTAARIHREGQRVVCAKINNTGHNIRRDQFEEYLKALTSFLRTLRQGAGLKG